MSTLHNNTNSEFVPSSTKYDVRYEHGECLRFDKITGEQVTYSLMQGEYGYRENTLVSFYIKSNKPLEKKAAPCDINGYRYRLDLETGELRKYNLKEARLSLSASVRRTRILMSMLLDMNDFDWFCTLTFDGKKVDRCDDEAVLKVYTKFVHGLSRKYPNLRYMTFPERHENGAMHLHLIIGGVTPKELGLVNSGKVCCHWAYRKNRIASREYFERTKEGKELDQTDGLTVYNITSFTHGLTTATRIANREACKNYVRKYVDKALGSTDIFRKRFYYSKNLAMPSIVKKVLNGDLSSPVDVEQISEVLFHDYIRFADQVKTGDYNTVQAWISNDTKDILARGMYPVKDPRIVAQIDKVFSSRLNLSTSNQFN